MHRKEPHRSSLAANHLPDALPSFLGPRGGQQHWAQEERPWKPAASGYREESSHDMLSQSDRREIIAYDYSALKTSLQTFVGTLTVRQGTK